MFATPLVANRNGGGGRGTEDGMPRAGDTVFVRAADDLGDLVEVEDRRRRTDLPFEGQRMPRVRLGDFAVRSDQMRL